MKGLGNLSFHSLKGPKGANRRINFMDVKQTRKLSTLVVCSYLKTEDLKQLKGI